MGYYNSPLPNYMGSFAAESFDLSLLPDDSAVPGSPEADLFSCLTEGGAVSAPVLYAEQDFFGEAAKGAYLKEEPLSPCGFYNYADSTCSSPGSAAQRCPSPLLDAILGSPEAAAVPLVKTEPRPSSLRGLLQEPPVRTQDELNALLQAPLKRSAPDAGFFQQEGARKRIKEEDTSVEQQQTFNSFYNIKEVRVLFFSLLRDFFKNNFNLKNNAFKIAYFIF
jgi:hypothetical protein